MLGRDGYRCSAVHDQAGVSQILEQERPRRMIGVRVRVDDRVESEPFVSEHREIPFGTAFYRIDEGRALRPLARDEIRLALAAIQFPKKHDMPRVGAPFGRTVRPRFRRAWPSVRSPRTSEDAPREPWRTSSGARPRIAPDA